MQKADCSSACGIAGELEWQLVIVGRSFVSLNFAGGEAIEPRELENDGCYKNDGKSDGSATEFPDDEVERQGDKGHLPYDTRRGW